MRIASKQLPISGDDAAAPAIMLLNIARLTAKTSHIDEFTSGSLAERTTDLTAFVSQKFISTRVPAHFKGTVAATLSQYAP